MIRPGSPRLARGLLTGMVLGAYQGLDAIPETWLTQLAARPRILQLLAQIDRTG